MDPIAGATIDDEALLPELPDLAVREVVACGRVEAADGAHENELADPAVGVRIEGCVDGARRSAHEDQALETKVLVKTIHGCLDIADLAAHQLVLELSFGGRRSGEGEAQASCLVKEGKAYAVASQDYDCLLFGAPRLIQNLTMARKRKTISGFVEIFPSMIELEKVLNSLQITHEQLICLGILVGTDYNPGGIKGIGQKKALDIVTRYKQPPIIFKQFPDADFDWQEIFQLFKKPDIDKNAEIQFPKINEVKIKEILMSHDFSEERIENQLKKLKEIKQKGAQKTLFG